MFFTTYKITLAILMGPGLFILLMAVTAIFLKLMKKGDKKNQNKINLMVLLLMGAALFMYAVSIQPVRDAAAAVSENKYKPIQMQDIPDNAAIVILGAGANDYSKVSFANSQEELGTPTYPAMARLVEGVRVYRKYSEKNKKEPLVITAGGKVYEGNRSEADIYVGFLSSLGVKKENIISENTSKTTYENGVNVIKILKTKNIRKIILVTSAVHMPRSVKVFEKNGDMEIIPAPCDYTSEENGYNIMSYIPEWDSISRTRGALWEIIGSVYYKVFNKS